MNKPGKNILAVNSIWRELYGGVELREKERKISFVDNEMKLVMQTECKCNSKEFLTCDLHDGSDPRNYRFFELIKNYFSNIRMFNEKVLIKQLYGNMDLVAFCLNETKDAIKRLEKRKQELFESDLYEFYVKKCLKNVPRVALIEDFDPKWDSIYLDLAAAKKQRKCTKISLIKGGARGIDVSFEYDHIPYIKKLHNLLENAYETLFLDFIIV
jgi:hypothetical protein